MGNILDNADESSDPEPVNNLFFDYFEKKNMFADNFLLKFKTVSNLIK